MNADFDNTEFPTFYCWYIPYSSNCKCRISSTWATRSQFVVQNFVCASGVSVNVDKSEQHVIHVWKRQDIRFSGLALARCFPQRMWASLRLATSAVLVNVEACQLYTGGGRHWGVSLCLAGWWGWGTDRIEWTLLMSIKKLCCSDHCTNSWFRTPPHAWHRHCPSASSTRITIPLFE